MNDRLLRVTVILSVFALVGVAAAGTAAAQPNFGVTNLDVVVDGTGQGADATAAEDESLTINADITNVGNQSGQQTIEFRLDADGNTLDSPGDVEDSTSVSLNASESTTVSLVNGQTPNQLGLSPGDFDHGVFSDNDSALGNLTVTQAGGFELSNLNVIVDGQSQGPDATAETEDPLTVEADVTNTGNSQQTQNVTFELPPNNVIEEKPVTVGANDTETVQFLNGQTPNDLGLSPGTFDHGVFSDNDSALGNLTVTQAGFDVSNLNVIVDGQSQGPDATAETEDPLTVEADVTNTGNSTATENVTFELPPGTVIEEKPVTVGANDTETVQFLNGQTPNDLGLSPGTFDHGVFTNPSVEGNLTVFDSDDSNLVSGIISDQTFDPIQNSGNVTFDITYIGGSGDNRATDKVLVDDVNVEDFKGGDVDPTDGIDSSVGSNTGFQEDVDGPNNELDRYRITLPNFGNSSRYAIRAREPGFKSFDGRTEDLDPGEGDTQDVQLERIALPERFEIDQSAESALGDGEDSIVFNVSIIGDVNEQRLTNEPFTVFHDGGSAVNIANGASFTTDSNGFVEFEVTSNVSQVVNFEFVADRLDRQDEEVVEIREKTFVLEGEGFIIGDVWDRSFAPGPTPEHRLPDAKIWAFQKERVSAQSIRVPPVENSTGDSETAFVNESQDSFFRLIKSEDPSTSTPSDDEILDVTQDYRIDNNGQNENLSISRVRELDENDSTVGSGWAVRANVDNPKARNATGVPTGTGMFVTPLESDPEAYYYVQQSENLLDASDDRFVDDSAPDDPLPAVGSVGSGSVYEIGGTSQFTVNREEPPPNPAPNQPTVDFVRRTGNLTFEAAQAFSTFSGQQLWDITDENGEYVLDDMFTDFQKGVDYTVFANKPGYEIEFIDPLVTENGALFENGEDENFGLRRIEQDPDVNITNIARLPDVGEAPEENADDPDSYDAFDFANQSDEFSQTLPRDGETVDVVLIETFFEGTDTPTSDTVELRIPDLINGNNADEFNFTGEWVATAGADSASGIGTDTLTVTTGSDGQAIAWLQTDLSTEDLAPVDADNVDNDGLVCGFIDDSAQGTPGNVFGEVFQGIVAQSTTNLGAIDTSCKDFRGVNIFESGSISGTVRNQDQGLPETVVWTREFVDTQGNLFTITPDDGTSGLASAGGTGGDAAVGQKNFTFAFYQRTGGMVPDPDTTAPTTTATFTANELRDFNSQQFGPIATPPGFNETFNFLRFPSDDPENLGDYSMDRVPAQDGPLPTFTGDRGVDYQRIQAVQYESAETGNGTSSNPVRIGFTEEGDVVIPVAPRQVIVAPDFQLENLSPADATVTEGDAPIDITADVNNTGLLDGAQDLELTVENASTGNVVFSDTVANFQVAAGNTQTVTFQDVPVGSLNAGEYNHIVSSDDDTIEGNLTVLSAGSDPVDQYRDDPSDPNSPVSTSGLQDAINDLINNNIGSGLLQDVINEFVSSQQS